MQPLQIKEVFYKEILPMLNVNNFGYNSEVIKKVNHMGKLALRNAYASTSSQSESETECESSSSVDQNDQDNDSNEQEHTFRVSQLVGFENASQDPLQTSNHEKPVENDEIIPKNKNISDHDDDEVDERRLVIDEGHGESSSCLDSSADISAKRISVIHVDAQLQGSFSLDVNIQQQSQQQQQQYTDLPSTSKCHLNPTPSKSTGAVKKKRQLSTEDGSENELDATLTNSRSDSLAELLDRSSLNNRPVNISDENVNEPPRKSPKMIENSSRASKSSSFSIFSDKCHPIHSHRRRKTPIPILSQGTDSTRRYATQPPSPPHWYTSEPVPPVLARKFNIQPVDFDIWTIDYNPGDGDKTLSDEEAEDRWSFPIATEFT
jgi:hypothetical protein